MDLVRLKMIFLLAVSLDFRTNEMSIKLGRDLAQSARIPELIVCGF